MRKPLLILALYFSVLAPASARADDASVYAGFECKAKENSIALIYTFIPEEDRPQFLANQPATMWDPWKLLTRSKQRIESLHPVSRPCKLGAATYSVTIAPEPGNMLAEGRCSGHMGASATIARDGKQLHTITFESRLCFDMNTPIITRAIFTPGVAELALTTVPSNRFRY